MTDRELYATLVEKVGQGIPAAMATIVTAHGSTPRSVGAKMLIFADASSVGTIGGGCGEDAVKRAALEAILVRGGPRLMVVDLTDELGSKEADVCGGKMKVFVQPVFPG
jgi:xanthine dehydrogenase accessory factor